MLQKPEKTCLLTKLRIRPEAKNEFAEWQSELNSQIAAFPGFLSLEILAPNSSNDGTWAINQRFVSVQDITAWLASDIRKKMMATLKPLLLNSTPNAFVEEISDGLAHGEVTEVFVTEVAPHMVSAFRKWMAKIHSVEATFPGFKGCYVQSPNSPKSKNWITFLQFDTLDNLENWLTSKERKAVLSDAEEVIQSLESHRMISPFAGWFSSMNQGVRAPAVWKQAMIVLLVLFPIVMLEMLFLNPYLKSLNPSLGMFIGNVISVGLVTWPTVPLAIHYLKWWLTPPIEKYTQYTVLGTLLVCVLYIIEIAVFWNFV